MPRTHALAPLVVLVAGALAPGLASAAPTVLLYDNGTGNLNARLALASLGWTYTLSTSTTFTTQIASGSYDVVVVDMPSTVPTGGWEAAIQTHVAGGGRAVMSYWAFQSSATLPSTFQCASSATFSTPLPIYSWASTHAVWTSPNAVPTLTGAADTWADDGDRLNVASGGTAVGGFTAGTAAGNAAIVIGNSGRTIYNGFLFDEFTADTDKDGTRDIVELIANELAYVWGGVCGDSDGDGFTAATCGGTDCNDALASIYPGADETCNGVDDDCDTVVDEDPIDGSAWYADADGDGFGDDGSPTDACDAPSGFVADATDCWDEDADVNPDGTEAADGVDGDCDGTVDEGTDWYDDDGDGYTEEGGDCDDGDDALAPSTVEICNGLDDDCDGVTDEGTDCYDDDGDGLTEAEADCNDADADVGPTEAEIEGNGIDDDCDGEVDGGAFDEDEDGYGIATDCADDDDATYPGAPEVADGVDNDCDGIVDEGTDAYDDDGDGFTEADGDCNDDDDTMAPDTTETANGRDDDCDGLTDEGTDVYDDDGDGFSEEAGDCDDDDETVNPGAEETANGADDDCDGDADEGADDVDGDGYTEADGDCDDREGWAHPGAEELCDSIDNDCDGEVDDDCLDDRGDVPATPGKCGCASGAGAGGAFGWLLALGLVHRRRQVGVRRR